jgi:transcriptional regulator with XRE-family HTH domain
MAKRMLNRIKLVLVEKGMTSRELAKGLNKTESTVSTWCTNDKQPSVETFYQIAQFLDVDLRELFVQTKKN